MQGVFIKEDLLSAITQASHLSAEAPEDSQNQACAEDVYAAQARVRTMGAESKACADALDKLSCVELSQQLAQATC